MNSEESISQYPILHVYPLLGPRQTLHLKANTLGLRSLLDALNSALSYHSEGVGKLMCSDAEPFEVRVQRIDTDDEWAATELPYPELMVSDQTEVEEGCDDERVADFYNYYANESDFNLHEQPRTFE